MPGFEPPLATLPQDVLCVLAEARDQGRRLVSICNGAFALAAAGVLDGLHATTHWQHTDDARGHPCGSGGDKAGQLVGDDPGGRG